MVFKKKEETTAAATPTSTPKSDSSSEKAPASKSGKRELVEFFPSERKALVKVGGKQFKVVYDTPRDSDVQMIGLDGQPLVKLSDWLDGKADLNLGT